MITERELLEAIKTCQKDPITYQNIEKLANLFTVHDHLYGSNIESREKRDVVKVIETRGDSEFLKAVNGKDSDKVFDIIDDLMSTLAVVNNRVFDSVIRKMDEI